MAKTATGGKVQYDEVVKRLEAIVESLEGGELSLEDSLERFAEGINLLSEDGRTAPIEVKELPAAPSTAATRPAPPASPKKPAPAADDDDVPF